MTKQQRIDEQNLEIEALRRNLYDYKARHNRAIDALSDVARGFGKTRNGSWSAANLAADELAEIAKMPLREAP